MNISTSRNTLYRDEYDVVISKFKENIELTNKMAVLQWKSNDESLVLSGLVKDKYVNMYKNIQIIEREKIIVNTNTWTTN